MARPGRHYHLTTVAVCCHLILRHGRCLPTALVRRVAASVRRSWQRGERRMAPADLFSHMETAPTLRRVMPAVHRVVDTLVDDPPRPAVDDEGRTLHAIARRDAVLVDMEGRGAGALVWESSPAIGVVFATGGRCIVVRGGHRGRCVTVDRARAADMVARVCGDGQDAVACNVFYDAE